MTAALLADLAELERIAAVRKLADEETRAFLEELAAIEEAIEDMRREDGLSRWEPAARVEREQDLDAGDDIAF